MRDKVESELVYIKKKSNTISLFCKLVRMMEMADPIYSKVISHRWKGVMVGQLNIYLIG